MKQRHPQTALALGLLALSPAAFAGGSTATPAPEAASRPAPVAAPAPVVQSAPAPVAAARPAAVEPAFTVSAHIGLVSDYAFRGVSQTDEDPTIQGGVDLAHASGLYAGLWASGVDDAFIPGDGVEIDVYGGYNHKVNDDLTVSAGLLQYLYPGVSAANTLEANLGATYKGVNVKYSRTTDEYFGVAGSKGSGYLEVNYGHPLTESLRLDLHAGRQKVKNNTNLDYKDYKVGLTSDFGKGLSGGLHYVTTSGAETFFNGKEVSGDRVIASVLKTF